MKKKFKNIVNCCKKFTLFEKNFNLCLLKMKIKIEWTIAEWWIATGIQIATRWEQWSDDE